jgi:putative Mn2+ efflux pump MntP
MSFFTLFLLGIALSMDAFAVAVCKGLALRRINVSNALTVGLYFGLFQAGMPLLGYLLGSLFYAKVAVFDHWIAFILLGIIGARMIQESFSKEEKPESASLSVPNMLLLAIATSIDALAVGITFAFLNVNIYYAITIIGVTTFSLSVAGVKIGSIFGTKYKSRAEFVGGAVLIVLGVRILFQHLFFK